jgi:fumarylacetoacetase
MPTIEPTARLDYELEMGFIYGSSPTSLGHRLCPSEAKEHLFGVVLLNDWSSRDIQAWEYVPLGEQACCQPFNHPTYRLLPGPFLSKNFCTTISPWIVTCEALEPFKVEAYKHEPALLPYLEEEESYNYNVDLAIDVKVEGSEEYHRMATSNLRHTYYTAAQMLAHHTTTGCPMKAGDLLGTGTLSAPNADGLGSLLEKSEMGKKPYSLGQDRKAMTFLQDGDSVRFTGSAKGKGYTIGFGECEGKVLKANPL